jgi:Protein of unknown function, DUF547
MIKYAFLKVGVVPAKTTTARATFYSTIKFNVGGHLYSFQDWENGFLRGNAKAPHGFVVPFGKTDPRYSFIVKMPDPRMHFALNCGARSSPPVNRFSVEHLDEELNLVAASFCEDDDNVKIDTNKREMHISKIFSWYRADFTDNANNLPQLLSSYMKGMKKQALDLMLNDGKGSVKVAYLQYDWSHNYSSHLVFDAETLKADEAVRGIRNFIPGSPRKSPRKDNYSNNRSPEKLKGDQARGIRKFLPGSPSKSPLRKDNCSVEPAVATYPPSNVR